MRWFCIASGPSLTTEDCELVRDRHDGPTIVVNTTFRRAPWADILVAQDDIWWKVYGAEVNFGFPGERVRLVRQKFGRLGNSGHAAIELACQRGASEVVLLGYDYGNGTHWHGEHDTDPDLPGRQLSNPGEGEFKAWHRRLREAKFPATLINCSRETTIPQSVATRLPLEDVLSLGDEE